jgi:hypothetical protein
MDATAGRMARGADELKEVSEASKSLYGSLDDPQKRKFEFQSREIVTTVNSSMGGSWGRMTMVPRCQKNGMKNALSLVPVLELQT